ncbi:MAG TPA: hypothetical protein VKA70_02080 [Blastocatellia bacterium]|nr:hypothetical protein [Blastocatellia bacterium]
MPFWIRPSAITVLLATVALLGGATEQAAVAPEEALRRAVAAEDKLKAAERDYSYRQEITVQMFGEANSVVGQMRRVSQMTYDDLGNRVERIIEFPPSRLTNLIGVMKPDFRTLIGVDPFFLTSDALAHYTVKFVERQKIDELNTYVFSVEPASRTAKHKEGEPFPFSGRVWVDDQDFQIVKVEGRAITVKDDKQRFPKFEYYRENVDGKLWMPSFVYGRDLLEFPRYDIPILVEIKYSEYKKASPRR